MSHEDLYKEMGVNKSATEAEIRSAYRKLAKKFHPDRNPGNRQAEEKFKRVQDAYDVLGDTKKRTEYDQFGKAGVGQFVNEGGNQYYTWGEGTKVRSDDLEDLFSAFGGSGDGRASVFEQVFGSRRGRGRQPAQPQAPTRGQNVERPVSLSFEQAIHGTTVEIDLVFNAQGRQKRQTLSVKIPPNVSDGQKIRVRGKGGPGQSGGSPGDMFIVCRVGKHQYFRREGHDIHLDVPISITEAILGTKVDVPTLHGTITVAIPPGTSSGSRLRLRGKGIPATGNGSLPGDQYIVVQIAVPNSLDDEQRSVIESCKEALDVNPRENLSWS